MEEISRQELLKTRKLAYYQAFYLKTKDLIDELEKNIEILKNEEIRRMINEYRKSENPAP